MLFYTAFNTELSFQNQTENEQTLYKVRIVLGIFLIHYANFPQEERQRRM